MYCNLLLKKINKLQKKKKLNIKSPQTASRSSEKRQKHSKHTTGNGIQTLFRFLGILHGIFADLYFGSNFSSIQTTLILRFG